jgi:hypothetical protein
MEGKIRSFVEATNLRHQPIRERAGRSSRLDFAGGLALSMARQSRSEDPNTVAHRHGVDGLAAQPSINSRALGEASGES